MSNDATPRLSLPYIAAGQAQKHVTLNESLALLDGLVQTAVESRTTNAQPASPADGDLYIMTATPSGTDWAGKAAGVLMRYESGVWNELALGAGWIAWVKDEGAALIYDGSTWTGIAAAVGELENLSLLGVNTTADATNKLTVSSAAVLFNHAGAGSQVKVNKNAAGDTASHLFQTGFSGRAEFGLTGDDDFHLKVSADGSTWKDVFSIDRTSGRASFTLSPSHQTQTDVFTANGTYTVPSWARRLLVTCIGAGGGGASGSAGTSAANVNGGGGAGAGGRAEEWFDVADVAATLSVTVGAGGSGGTGVTGTSAGANGVFGGTSSVSSSGTILIQATGGSYGFAALTGGYGGQGNSGLTNSGGNGSTSGSGISGAPYSGMTFPAMVDLTGPGAGGGGGGLGTGGASTYGNIGGVGYWKGGTGHKATGGATSILGGAGFAGTDKTWTRGAGGGGSGGGGTAGAVGGAGGAGGIPGGGGGGGGGSRDTFTSGAGGAGARGEVVIVAFG